MHKYINKRNRDLFYRLVLANCVRSFVLSFVCLFVLSLACSFVCSFKADNQCVLYARMSPVWSYRGKLLVGWNGRPKACSWKESHFWREPCTTWASTTRLYFAWPTVVFTKRNITSSVIIPNTLQSGVTPEKQVGSFQNTTAKESTHTTRACTLPVGTFFCCWVYYYYTRTF